MTELDEFKKRFCELEYELRESHVLIDQLQSELEEVHSTNETLKEELEESLRVLAYRLFGTRSLAGAAEWLRLNYPRVYASFSDAAGQQSSLNEHELAEQCAAQENSGQWGQK